MKIKPKLFVDSQKAKYDYAKLVLPTTNYLGVCIYDLRLWKFVLSIILTHIKSKAKTDTGYCARFVSYC